MMQSEYEEIEDDETECDCEVCRANAEEDADEVEQLAVDRVSDTEWQICDFASGEQPATYLLTVREVEGNPYANKNFLLVECDCDNFDNAFEDYQVFLREIWSADVYVTDSSYERLAAEILNVIPKVKLHNPIELAYLFGGKVHHRAINMPIIPKSN